MKWEGLGTRVNEFFYKNLNLKKRYIFLGGGGGAECGGGGGVAGEGRLDK